MSWIEVFTCVWRHVLNFLETSDHFFNAWAKKSFVKAIFFKYIIDNSQFTINVGYESRQHIENKIYLLKTTKLENLEMLRIFDKCIMVC